MNRKYEIVKMREEIVKQCLARKPLFGKDGAFAPMIQSILNAVLEGEMDAHMTEEENPATVVMGRWTNRFKRLMGEVSA